MNQARYRIRGSLVEAAARPRSKDDVIDAQVRRLAPSRSRQSAEDLEVASDDVSRVILDNGFELWTRTDDLIREYGRETVSRDGGQAWDFDRLTPQRGVPTERGLAGLAIKALEFFGFDLKKETAANLAPWFEEKQFKGHEAGLYRCSLDDSFDLQAEQHIPDSQKPILVLLHGTASSVAGSFGKLWEPSQRDAKTARESFKRLYGDRVYALQHRTLTESPIANALALAEKLPQDAEVHVVSHSRGGLVGELLCLAQCETRLPPDQIKKLFAADRTIAQQIGLSPLDGEASRKRDEAYNEDRERLIELIDALKSRRIKVTRYVRVACPARGTTLASGRLDRWFSMLNFLAEQTTGGLFSDSLDFILGVVKQRTDPRTLPGLEAMMPGSALTRLLQHPDLITDADLSVIAGDIKGDSVWSRIKLLVGDWFYGSDHDLVVNTGSMFGGLKRAKGGARFLQDEGVNVNHFRYFTNEQSIGWLVKGLTRKDEEQAGFRPIEAAKQEEPRWREAVRRSRAAAEPRPLAIVLPGIMGSSINVRGENIWLSYWAIVRGHLDRLRLDSIGVESVDLLGDYYGPLLEFLAQSHRVEIFPYDWRLSTQEAAEKLRTQLATLLPEAERTRQPVHIIAHSMGGLVVRAMIASAEGGKLWRRCLALENCRILMLGAPNLGSYEAVRWLTGYNPTEAKLSLLDFVHDTNEIIDIVRDFPGLLELLPFDPDSPDFSQQTPWKTIQKALLAGWNSPDDKPLLAARSTWGLLKQAAPDGLNMVYVAGCQDVTVADYQIIDDPFSSTPRKRLQFLGVHEGDGTVTWKSGRLPNVPVWYVEDTAHDELCTKQRAFPAYLDLLNTGATTLLPSSPPAGARGALEKPAIFPLPVFPPSDDIPDERALRTMSFGIGRPPAPTESQAVTPPIQVSVRHGDLSYSRYPVLVGHYRGDTIISAEQTLDDRLSGALTRRVQLGLYPGLLGTHALFFSQDQASKGAIVVGLGQVGELSPALLQRGVRNALLEFALQVMQWPDDRFGAPDAIRSAAVSCLLVGSGSDGISVRDSLESILQGALHANERLANKKLSGKVLVDRIEFMDLYEDRALTAGEELERLLQDGELVGKVNWEPRIVEEGQGRLYRLRGEEPEGWWRPLEIIEEKIDNRWLGLRFIASTDRARAEMTQSAGQLRLAESFIADASNSAAYDGEAGKTLFEMLLPNRLKELAPHQGNLILLVDDVSARYPWEILEDRWNANARPPAIKAGLVRQLKTPQFRLRPAHALSKTAFVVGNPNLDGWTLFPDLPGARQEAQSVADLLNAGGFTVEACIGEKAKSIIHGLHQKPWRILHLAGHGEHEFPIQMDHSGAADASRDCEIGKTVQLMSGMVIGKDTFLTPGDIEQMRCTPELVFINCCHLGKTEARARRFNELAANLGVQFIEMGVKAVVAAGWAVDDQAARAFAQGFYTHMLAGETFGEAVRAAREEIWTRYPIVNTWGAYQCYGDPGFRLHDEYGVSPSVRVNPYRSPYELIADLENLAEQIRVQSGDRVAGTMPNWKEKISAYLARIPETKRADWYQRADVAAAIGFAWGELGEWAEAIRWLETAIRGAKSDCPLRVIEQCANFRVRHAVAQWVALRATSAADLEIRRLELIKAIERAIHELETLAEYGETKERLNLLGGSWKRLRFVQTERASRSQALSKMAGYYKAALDFANRSDAYAWTNWATAELLSTRFDQVDEATWSKNSSEIEAEAPSLREALRREIETNPNFWHYAGLADIDLVLLIAACPIVGQTLSIAAIELKKGVIKGYQRAITRGGSPREKDSLIENLDFMLEIIGNPKDPLMQAIKDIRDALLRPDF